MNAKESAVCRVIRAALFQQETAWEPGLPWEDVFREMRVQTVDALAGELLGRLPLSQALRERWRNHALKNVSEFFRLAAVQEELVQILEEAGVPFVILKGMAAACYYPSPWQRAMGDVDLIVAPACFTRAAGLLAGHGFVPAEEEEPGERHLTLTKDGILIEMHRHFALSEEDTTMRPLDEWILSELPQAQRAQVDQYVFPMLSTRTNGLVLLEHIHQHLKSGLGLRQIVDWMLYVRSCLHDGDWEAFRERTDRLGLTRLAETVTRMCQLYLGLSQERTTWCLDADEQLCSRLLAYIFRSGNFGYKDEESSAGIHAMTRLRQDFFGTLQSSGERNWKALHRHPWLRPFAWIYQALRYLRLGLLRGNGLRGLSQTLNESGQLEEMLEKMGIK